jgi:hypothetical protein
LNGVFILINERDEEHIINKKYFLIFIALRKWDIETGKTGE